MKFKQRSQIAFASSVAIHIVLLLVLSILGAFSILDKKDKPVEVIFFDSVGGSGGSGGSAPKQQTAPQVIQPPTVIDRDAIQDKNDKSQPVPAYTPAPAVGNQANDGESTGNDTGSGSGSGSGTGNGSGDGVGDGFGNGPVSNPAVPPRVTRHIAPDYPSSARSAGITGVVKLQVLISNDGDVQDVEVYESSGNGSLDSAAVRAVRNWQFTAARDSAGRRVACYTIIPIRFNLK